MGFLTIKKSIFAQLLIMLSLVLIASFGMHAIVLEHDHPGHAGVSHAAESDSLGNYMHGSDKKMFFYTVLGFLFLGVSFWNIGLQILQTIISIRTRVWIGMRSTRSFSLHSYDALQLMYSIGILNTKAY